MTAQASRGRSRSMVVPALCVLLAGMAAGSSACSSAVAEPQTPIEPTQPVVKAEFAGLAHELDQLAMVIEQAQTDPPPPGFAERLNVGRKDLRWLERTSRSWPASASVDELLATLADHRRLLAELPPEPAAERWRVIDAVVRDLAVKAGQCRKFGGPFPVLVNVVTLSKGQQELTGYEVWFVRKAYEDQPRAFRRFERNSSPAERTFREAGYYVLWTQQPGGDRRGPPLDVEVGLEQPEQRVDLSTPELESAAALVPSPDAALLP